MGKNPASKIKKTNPLKAISYEKIAFFFIWAGMLLILVHAVFFYWDGLIFDLASVEVIQSLGSYGEYVGSIIGAIWALAGVILYYEALKFQRRELTLQRHELELNRQEILEQTQQFREQNKTLMIQTFENTFFQLIMLHNEIVKSINIDSRDSQPQGTAPVHKLAGRDCFIEFFNYFNFIYQDHIDLLGFTSPTEEDMRDSIRESFERFFYMYHADLGHYLRNLYIIFKFIYDSKVKNYKFYINLIRAQLSDYELILIFYYGLSKEGGDLKHMIEKFSLFGKFPQSELLDRRHTNLYETDAFEEKNLQGSYNIK